MNEKDKVTDNSPNQAVSEIYAEYKNPLKRFIRKFIPSKEEGEDILHDVFYQLARVDLEINPIDQISAWLYRVAKNQIIDNQRKHREESMPSIADNDEDNISLIKDMLDLENILNTDSPESNFYKSLIWEELYLALDELPDEQKDVFVLNELEGISFKEISEATGITVNTLISRKRYAVLHLRKKLAMVYNDLMNII